MTQTTKVQLRAAIVIIAPLVLLAGFIYHPFVQNLTDTAAVAAAAESDTTRWGISHLLVGVGAGLVALAFLAVRSYLRDAGEERWSAPALPFIIMGSTLYAILPGMEFALLAAVDTGADVQATQAALDSWFLPILMTAAASFAIGALGFAMGIARSGVLSPRLTWIVAGALVVMGVGRFVPLGAVQFYVGGAAATVALWPLAYEMWRHPELQLARQQPLPAT